MVYVIENGCPLIAWKANADPVNTNEPELNGPPVNCYIRDMATFPLPNSAFNGSPYY